MWGVGSHGSVYVAWRRRAELPVCQRLSLHVRALEGREPAERRAAHCLTSSVVLPQTDTWTHGACLRWW